MASLRRMASLDCISNPSSSPASLSTALLIRHSSLPNLFLCQPELAIGALHRYPSLNKGSLFVHECRSSPIASKVALVCCAALPGSQYLDETPEFEKPTGVDGAMQGGFFRPSANVLRQSASNASNKKEPILDLEKSVVYSELRESVCRWEVPPRFFKPYDIGQKIFAERGTHIQILQKPDGENKSQISSDLCMQKISAADIGLNDVKGRPMSLRMLKRKLSKVAPQAATSDVQWKCKPKELIEESCASELASLCGVGSRPQLTVMQDVGDSVFSAFASLVYMLKMLQQHSLSPCMQSHARSEDAADEKFHQNWVGRAYAEMLDSFLWLFQQVFCCTPKLMLLTMMLLADFTLHSVSKHVAFPVMPLGEPPTPTTLVYKTANPTKMGGVGTMSYSATEEEQQFSTNTKKLGIKEGCFEEILPCNEHGGPGGGDDRGGTTRVIKHGASYSDLSSPDDLYLRKLTPESSVTNVDVDVDDAGGKISSSSSSSRKSALLLHDVADIKGIDLDAATKNMLVAPVRAPVLEADDYPCFDRTDLAYQQEISMDPSNPLLLANYAQFLHVVRHDNCRAEKLYRRAVMVDRYGDGEVVGRFASFLWVVKGDVVEAESAYKAAVSADPTNVYHAGCYAHFLWSSSACQAEEPSCCSSMDNLGTVS